MVTHIHSMSSGTCIFNLEAGRLILTQIDTPPEFLATLLLQRLNFWYSLKGSLSAVTSLSQVSVKTAISTLFDFKIASVSIVLSVSSLLPKLCIFAKSIKGNLYFLLVVVVVTPFLLLAMVVGLVHGGLWPPPVVVLVLVVVVISVILGTSSTGILVLAILSVVIGASSVRGLMLVVLYVVLAFFSA